MQLVYFPLKEHLKQDNLVVNMMTDGTEKRSEISKKG